MHVSQPPRLSDRRHRHASNATEFARARFDFVVFANLLHFLAPDDVERMLKKAHAALGPEGQAFIVASMQAPTGEIGDEVWNQLEMLTMAPRGTLYTWDEYREMLSAAGYSDIERRSAAIVSARKQSV